MCSERSDAEAGQDAIHLSRRVLSEGTNLRLWQNPFLFADSLSLWYLIRLALLNQHEGKEVTRMGEGHMGTFISRCQSHWGLLEILRHYVIPKDSEGGVFTHQVPSTVGYRLELGHQTLFCPLASCQVLKSEDLRIQQSPSFRTWGLQVPKAWVLPLKVKAAV